MFRFLAARLVRGVILIGFVVVATFLVTHVVADPVRQLLPLDADEESYDRLAAELGLDRPLGTQFEEFMGGAVRLDFGESYWDDRDALEVVMDSLPRTFRLVGAGMVLATLIGVPLGLLMAVSTSRRVQWLSDKFSVLLLSVPQFWIALMLILFFAVRLQWFPTSGDRSASSLVLPAVTLALGSAGKAAQVTRATVRDQLKEPYVRNAIAAGLPRRRLLVHLVRNSSVPIVTLLGFEAVTALAGFAILVESVFAWPGIGLTTLTAVSRNDIPVTAAVVFVVSSMVIVFNMLIDVFYRVVDPRAATS